MNAHTPGPWTNDPLQPSIWAKDGSVKVATVSDLPWINGKSDWLTEQANARLIAAAPDLLHCLCHLGRELQAAFDDVPAGVDAWMAQARIAIAKATSQAS